MQEIKEDIKMNKIMQMRNEEIVTMTSLEVVDLINKFREEEGTIVTKEHKTFMRDIRNEIEYLKKAGIEAENNFVPGSYIDKNKQERPCYKMNKAGIMQMLNKESALVRYKTQQYIEALENRLKQDPYESLSTEMKALLMHDKKIQEVQKEIVTVQKDLIDFKDNAPLFNIECDEISRSVRNVGVKTLGGKKSKAYRDKSLRAQIYTDIYHQLKRQFGVNSYKAIKRGQLSKALEIISEYEAPLVLRESIEITNRQLSIA